MRPGTDPTRAMAEVDAMFQNGPQRVQTTTEAEYNRQFISMLGNVPALLGGVGGAVVFAIFFAVLNTMLMAGRERTRDLGIMKALGYANGRIGALLIAESLVLVLLGSGLGVLLAKGMEAGMGPFVSAWAPGFAIDGAVLGQGLAFTLLLGLVSGIAPGFRARRLMPVTALREDA
jgi:putative ABC transport system permease protein